MSEQPKWTPGPWSAFWDDNGYWYIEPLGVTGTKLRGDSGECLESANARLIASAPQMYSTADDFLTEAQCVLVSELGSDWADSFGPLWDKLQALESALAKARGVNPQQSGEGTDAARNGGLRDRTPAHPAR